MVVKVTVVVGDNKQTNKQTLSSSFFLFCFFTFFWRQTKRETFFRVVEETKILGGKRSLGRLFELSDVELSSTLTHRKLHFLTHTNTHTHTHTHNVRFTIPNRRRQGRLQSCRQQATTIHRRLGEDCPRQRYALEERTIFQGRRELIHKFCLSMDKEEERDGFYLFFSRAWRKGEIVCFLRFKKDSKACWIFSPSLFLSSSLTSSLVLPCLWYPKRAHNL